MKIDLASKVLEMPEEEILKIVSENRIRVERFVNGVYNFTFQNLVTIYNAKHRHKVRNKWKDKALQLEKELSQARRGVMLVSGHKWYPSKKRRRVVAEL